jgi:hypothetical protein
MSLILYHLCFLCMQYITETQNMASESGLTQEDATNVDPQAQSTELLQRDTYIQELHAKQICIRRVTYSGI